MKTQTEVEEELAAIARQEKELIPGTMGWTSSDLEDPRFDGSFSSMPYEVSDGVLTIMPPAYFSGGAALTNLTFLVQQHLRLTIPRATVATEVDVILSPERVVKVDAIYLSPEEIKEQRKRDPKRHDPRIGISRVVVPPTLVIESVSIGHERRDQIVKFGWYEAFGVMNYWLLDAQRKTLECYGLVDGRLQLDTRGEGTGIVTPGAFAPLQIDLDKIWADEI